MDQCQTTPVTVALGFAKSADSTRPITTTLRVEQADDGAPVLDVELTEHQLAMLLSGSVVRTEARL